MILLIVPNSAPKLCCHKFWGKTGPRQLSEVQSYFYNPKKVGKFFSRNRFFFTSLDLKNFRPYFDNKICHIKHTHPCALSQNTTSPKIN